MIAVACAVLATPILVAGWEWRYVLPTSFVYFVLSGFAVAEENRAVGDAGVEIDTSNAGTLAVLSLHISEHVGVGAG